ncbi:hypothetical protein TNCV_674131 [Trichonephila clavipes]|uniref:Uncharacterized protein n=1 Tax=Trichonephila clavipes TaxID=2585209 RepID=A0A8X7BIR8_TRICX|nr:hypothetical protein TNCV_674131 [Trichonephila clavipes]
MPVVSDPCSCQPDCLVCGRGEVPPHDCAIHVLFESMVFQEHNVARRAHRSKIGGNFTELKRIFTPRHAYDGPK